jgi:hypothetical protein
MRLIALQRLELKVKLFRLLAYALVGVAPLAVTAVAGLLIVTDDSFFGRWTGVALVAVFAAVFLLGLQIGQWLVKRLSGDILQALITDLNLTDEREVVLQEYARYVPSYRVMSNNPDLVLRIEFDPPSFVWERQGYFIEHLRKYSKSGTWKITRYREELGEPEDEDEA